MQQSVFDPTLLGANSLLRVRSKRLFDRAIFLALLVFIGLTATPLGAAELWWSPVFECIVFALAAIWAIECLINDSWGLVDHHLALPLIALAFFAFVQSIPFWGLSPSIPFGEGWVAISADPYETKRFAIRLLALAFALALLLRYTSTRPRYLALILVVVVVGLASSLWVLAPRVGAFTGLWVRDAIGFGQFANRNHFAFLMEMVIGLIIGIVLKARLNWRIRLIYLLLVGPLWVTLILTRSRGGLLALASAVLFLVFMFGFIKPAATSLLSRRIRLGRLGQVSVQFITKVALAGCLAVALLSSVVLVGGNSLMRRLELVPIEFSLDGRTGGNRIDIWRATWHSIKAHPFFGSGFGAYGVAITPHHDASGKWVPHQAHNDYLELLAGGGVVGGALGIWFVVVFIKRALARLRSPDPFQGAACLGALAGIFAISIHSLFDFGLHSNTNALIFVSLVVIATGGFKKDETNGRGSEGVYEANHHAIRL